MRKSRAQAKIVDEEDDDEDDEAKVPIRISKRIQSQSPVRRIVKIQKTPEKEVEIEPPKSVASKLTGRKGKKKSPVVVVTSTQIEAPRIVIEIQPNILDSSIMTNDESLKTLNVTNDISKTPEISVKKKRTSSLPNKNEILDTTVTLVKNDDVENEQDDVINSNVKRPVGARIVKPVVNGVEIRKLTKNN
jgi:hypothetical protein